eukprot:TRINITY_DN89291_c0_g1_i1.p1 TRINITY_DN89291_c0_g1~~TRINITY_DN89291_c0_g1_i1.p1  ORF type:complete len:124 (+),score=21.90 TRINITY_DN89291_c0_g1_i1:175-546(+)
MAFRLTLALGFAAFASAYRKQNPEGNHRQASEDEMRTYVEEDHVDIMLLGASGVLLVAGLMHWSAGYASLAKLSAISGAATAALAFGLLDESIFGFTLLVAVVVYAVSFFAKPAAKGESKKVE